MVHSVGTSEPLHTYPAPLDMLSVAGRVGFSLPPYPRGFFPGPLTETCFLFCSPLSYDANVLVAACLRDDTNFLSSHPPWHGSENWQVTRKATPSQVLGISSAVATSFQRCHVDVTSCHVRSRDAQLSALLTLARRCLQGLTQNTGHTNLSWSSRCTHSF